ncbi:MAG: DNA repair protein RecO [Candidatus Staskawiczbacteria bacterium]|nr:DNA repair protein RecO [Candidatus Staskawiczbacteria bacterium]
MTLKYRTKGFVFKKNDINESDRVFSVFTEDFGRIEVRARALRKIISKLRADVDIFYFSEIEFIQGKNMKTLTDAVKIKKSESLYKNLRKLKVACQISDLLDDFLKGQESDKKIFVLIEEFFNDLDKVADVKNDDLVFQYFFWNFVFLQGYKLEAETCALCREKINPYSIYFSAKNGGVMCENCFLKAREGIKINSDTVKTLRLIFKKDWQTFSRLKMELQSKMMLKEVLEDAMHTFSPIHN